MLARARRSGVKDCCPIQAGLRASFKKLSSRGRRKAAQMEIIREVQIDLAEVIPSEVEDLTSGTPPVDNIPEYLHGYAHLSVAVPRSVRRRQAAMH